ncbi:unnamed protein product [Rotaria sp. Silwood2]|nr:unnamed protein product [Rotaria sp. Silwood2]CAF3154059.1 unnamed protein product [Rotaria sp. Silwood2]CAF4224480.1 unnamed protein product [Rotaria sp. Silwood2]
MSLKVTSTLELNGNEKIFCVDGNWVIIGFAAHLTGDRSIFATNAPHVLQSLLKRHSRMRTRVRVDGKRYLLEILNYDSELLSTDLFFSVVETTNESWQQIVENRCNQNPYSNNGTIIFPLFHFMLVFDRDSSNENRFHLLLFTNHCAFDSRSGFVLINDFFTLATSPNLLDISEPVNAEVLPFLAQLTPRPYGPLYPLKSFILKRHMRQELPKLAQPRIPVKSIPHVDCEPIRSNTQFYKTKFLFSSSSSNVYSNLHKICQSQQVTLNCPLFSCLLLAVHHCFPLDNNNRLEPFNIDLYFDMRLRLPRSPLTSSSVGFFVGTAGMKLKRSLSLQSTQFWLLAQKCMRMTRKRLQRNGVPLMINVFCDIMRHERQFERISRLYPEGRLSEIGFSNIGKYPFSCDYNHGQVRLHGLHIVSSTSLYRTSSIMYVTCAGDGQLDFSLGHEIENDERAKEFFDYYIHLIEACADSERCTIQTTLEQLLKSVE